MGHPRKHRKKYSTPGHPWEKQRILDEKKIIEEYGLKNKKEIWKSDFILKKFKSQAKKITASRTEQSEKEKKELLDKLFKLSLLPKTAKLDDILELTLQDILNRRLQTLTFKKGLARSVKQARQLIVHRHISIGDNVVNVPSYLLTSEQEASLSYNHNSPFINSEHPERAPPKKKEVKTQEKLPEKKQEAKPSKEKEEPKKEAPKKEEIKEEKNSEDPKEDKKEESKEKVEEKKDDEKTKS